MACKGVRGSIPQLHQAQRIGRIPARDQGRRVVVVSRLQQRTWTAEDGSARSTVEVVAEELGPSLRWATAAAPRTTGSGEQ